MTRLLVMALCLPWLLSLIRVKGQSMVATSTDIEDTLVNLEEPPSNASEPSIDAEEAPVFASESAEAPAFESEPAEAPVLAPSTERRSRFEFQIDQAITRCRGENGQTTCSWQERRVVISEGLVVDQEVSEDDCCCACHRVAECEAIHYVELEGRCVFHQGPIRRDRRQGGTKRWRKP